MTLGCRRLLPSHPLNLACRAALSTIVLRTRQRPPDIPRRTRTARLCSCPPTQRRYATDHAAGSHGEHDSPSELEGIDK
jgi:hypothetical protein